MFIVCYFFIPALLGIVFLCCKVFYIVKVGSSTLLEDLSFRHPFVRVVRVADIHVAWLVYLAYLRSHVLRAYCNFESKRAISKTLLGRRPNNRMFKLLKP